VLLVFASMVFRWPGESPLLQVEEPVRGLAVVAQRTLDLHEAAALAGPWEGAVYEATMGDPVHDLARAAAWYEEVVTHTDAPEAELHLAVLEGELGRLARVRERVARWRAETGPVDARAPLLEAAYLGGASPPVPAARVAALLESLEEGWFRDRLRVRLGEAEGDPGLAESGRAATAARARRLLARARVLSLVDAALLAGGVAGVALLVRRARRGASRRVARAPIPPPWSGWTGAAVLVRAGAAGLALVFLAAAVVEEVAPHPLLDAGVEALIAVPLVVLARRRLFAPAGLGLAAGLGLRPGPGGWGTLLLASLGLAAAGLVLDLGVLLLGEAADAEVHWAEWFEPALAWGGAADVAAVLVGAVVVAPAFEELAFRGILYATLRRRLGVGAAAVVSGGVFALAHGYGLTGLATVFTSGVLWAWAYERTGSLLPGIAAHAVNNLGVAAALFLLLRP
jgi:membrane protease YdiL (CAAX protease family)